MTEDNEILRGSIETAMNHLARSKEGRKLLEDGRSLAEMTTPLTGLTNEQTIKRREDYINWLKGIGEDQLYFVFQNTMALLQQRWEHPDKGTSELELRRIFFEDEFERRGLKMPDLINQNKTVKS
ncbi:hypothetical protein COT75_03870 [Candidatus Beckwithbacteria bacterium CG10_big_fil_rev_8_21_14_0_10_34_10]|uniref:Uncharacterized protein n=1 Tax=Candidatus Beckwithbacteria bacterium CG10_big_fil_rev_8_21_14_0_10_34_10 TaxID=1974495 RepID=A0A2H0W8I4_9BACT|nr:MAG: hypothetical protein COT75_03870 [Candidatus Beckwithbacteria bacterium CG10_big_fil_rev_8_21_14_0_10_34_10]